MSSSLLQQLDNELRAAIGAADPDRADRIALATARRTCLALQCDGPFGQSRGRGDVAKRALRNAARALDRAMAQLDESP